MFYFYVQFTFWVLFRARRSRERRSETRARRARLDQKPMLGVKGKEGAASDKGEIICTLPAIRLTSSLYHHDIVTKEVQNRHLRYGRRGGRKQVEKLSSCDCSKRIRSVGTGEERGPSGSEAVER
jgi:hypothetical protein